MPDNELLDELKQRIAEDSVVFVVGSGVSVQATGNAPCASWTGLLRHGIDYALSLGLMTEPVANLTRQQIDSADLDLVLGAAQTLRAKLGNDFRAWLQDSVGKLALKNPEVVDALHSTRATLATTNYDHLLGVPPVPWTEAAAVEEVLRGHRKGVIHLHGDFEHPDSVILDLRSYAQVVANRHANAILSAVRTLKTLVFVGCGDGLADPHFDEFFRWTEEALADSPFRHFILCRMKDVDEIRRKHSPERKLYPMPYGAEYKELPTFLRSLALVPRTSVELPRPGLSIASTTLPDPGPCFGRKAEVAAIVEALLAEAPARIAVLGTGGIGKTTVTLTALRKPQVAARFGHNRFFVRCDAATDRDGLVSAIAANLGITSGGQLASAVLAALTSSPAILVLDNFETPWQSATIEVEDFLTLLSGIDRLQLVITMRGVERPAGILWRDPVEPLRLPLPAAREAFLSIATRFEDDPDLDELLEAMDRLPLAITLLAHIAQREMHLEPLLNRWNDKRTAMLRRAGGEAKATNIEVSFELSIASPRMTSDGRRLLSILAILPSGIAETDLSVLLSNGDTAAGVLRACGLSFDEAGRFRMLAPLRAYVEKAYPIDAADEQRVISHYLGLGVRGDKLGSIAGADAAERLTPEVGNLEAILRLAVSRVTANELANATVGYGEFARFTGLGSFQVVEHIIASVPLSGDSVHRARCLMELGLMAASALRFQSAADFYLEALRICQTLGDLSGEARCIRYLGNAALGFNDLSSAELRLHEALPLCRNVGDAFGEAHCIHNLGEVALRRRDLRTAKNRFNEALILARNSSNSLCEANCAYSLARVAQGESDVDSERVQLEIALALYQDIGSVLGQANATFGIAVLRRTEDKTEAHRLAQRALLLYERIGFTQEIEKVHAFLADFAN